MASGAHVSLALCVLCNVKALRDAKVDAAAGTRLATHRRPNLAKSDSYLVEMESDILAGIVFRKMDD